MSVSVTDVAASAPSAPQAGQTQAGKVSEDFLQMLFPESSGKLPPGPEPPPTEKAIEVAGEAAKTPNVKSQKLDSKQSDKKTTSNDGVQVNPLLVASSGLVNLVTASSGVKQTTHTGIIRQDEPKSEKIEGVSAKGQNSDDKGDGEEVSLHGLPVDPDVPITSIKTFTVSDSKEAAFQVNSDSSTWVNPLNPTIAEKLASQNAKSPLASEIAPTGKAVEIAGGSSSATPTKHVGLGSSTESAKTTPSSQIVPSASAQAFGSQTGSSNQDGGHSHGKGNSASTLANVQSLDKTAKVADVVTKFETFMATRPKNGVTVELAPKDLGNISFTLKTFGKSVETQFSATNADVRMALSSSKSDLTHSMSTRGYTVSGMVVSGQDSGSSNSGGQSQPRQFRNSFSNAQSFATDSSIAPTSAPLPSSRALPSGVDLWI